MLPLLNSYGLSAEDNLATLVKHEVRQIGKVISALSQPGEILVTGGGAHNRYFMQQLNDEVLKDQELIIPSRQIIDYKEALIFGLMGVLRLRNEINCLKSVTGAKQDSSSGRIFSPVTT